MFKGKVMGLLIYFSWKHFTNYLVTWCETLFDAVIVDALQNIVKNLIIKSDSSEQPTVLWKRFSQDS